MTATPTRSRPRAERPDRPRRTPRTTDAGRTAGILAVRSAVRCAALLVFAALAACSSPPRVDVPVGPIPLRLDAALAVETTPEQGVDARVTLLVEPVAPWETLTLLSRRPAGESGDDARMLVRTELTEYPGTGPVSFGRSTSQVVAFGDDPGPAAVDRPVLRTFPLEVNAQTGVLARKLVVSGTLHPVDAIVERTEMVDVERDGETVLEPQVVTRRSAGAPIPLPRVQRVWIAVEPPEADVAALLADEAPPTEIFLASARTLDAFWTSIGGLDADDRKRDVFDAVEALIEALDEIDPAPDRIDDRSEAIFASLLLLTDASAGRDVARWRRWWASQDTNPLN